MDNAPSTEAEKYNRDMAHFRDAPATRVAAPSEPRAMQGVAAVATGSVAVPVSTLQEIVARWKWSVNWKRDVARGLREAHREIACNNYADGMEQCAEELAQTVADAIKRQPPQNDRDEQRAR